MSGYDYLTEVNYLATMKREKIKLEKTLNELISFSQWNSETGFKPHSCIESYLNDAKKELKAKLYDFRNIG